jgi:hypothetical protein
MAAGAGGVNGGDKTEFAAGVPGAAGEGSTLALFSRLTSPRLYEAMKSSSESFFCFGAPFPEGDNA